MVYYISRSGDGFYYPLAVLIAMLVSLPEGLALLKTGSLAFLIELPIYKLIKNTVKRNRPFAQLTGVVNLVVPSDTFSFPSGHTAGAVIMAAQLGFYFPVLIPYVMVWAIAVAFSRICLGVHYPGDILAGAAMGLLSSWAATQMIV